MSRQEAETMVKVIATLHSRFWGDPILDTQFTWLKDAYAYQLHINDLIGFKERTTLGLERSLKLLPGDLPGKKNLLWPAMMRATELRSQAPRTLLHADIHLGNWYITDSRAMGLCDWQCTVKGQWAVDFAYAVTSSLEPDERRAWERDLLKLYLDSLELPAGQVKPTMEEAWLAYRQQTLHGLYNWFFVAGISASETEMHSNAISASNLTRMATAAADLDTLGALGY
jgi:hypothetical protein